MGRAAGVWHHRRWMKVMEVPLPQVDDLSRSLVAFDQDATLDLPGICGERFRFCAARPSN
jgi:hypothetical protein